jgi:phosphoglycolate phosphatase
MARHAQKAYRLIIFDWDGTLLDSTHAIVAVVQKTAAKMCLNVPDAQIIRQGIGSSFEDQFQRLFPGQSSAVMIEFKSIFYEFVHNDRTQINEHSLFSGVTDLLAALSQKSVVLAIATSASRAVLDDQLSQTKLASYFAMTVCASEAAPKPDPYMLTMILTELNYKVEESLMVGDTVFDLAMGGAINMDIIGVNSGTQTKNDLQAAHPLLIVNNILALKKHLLG